MKDIITLGHGSGGKQMHDLIKEIFTGSFGMPEPLTDSAILDFTGNKLAFTTDSYVVDPLFFPGGNIGKLAVCGTVNDLAVSGARPLYLSASFIIEEGFPFAKLSEIAASMAEEAHKAGIKIVTGDTKVVEKGKCDGLFITTSGAGAVLPGREHISSGKRIRPGDKLIINGPPGNHSIAVLGARKDLSFTTNVVSDCAALNHLIESVYNACDGIHFMRDVTRGGLAAVLNEIAGITGMGMSVDEPSVPVDDPVRGACEMLGFDPLYLANEGKVLIIAGAGSEDKILGIMRSDPAGTRPEIIGEVLSGEKNHVILNTVTGGKRIIDMPIGLQLPRIC